MKQFAIIGMGRFGSSLAKTLYSLGHEVLAIDADEERLQEVSESVTHAAVADATDEQALSALGIRNFDVAVVSMGDNLQASILICLLCKELGVKYVLAKANTEVHAKVLKKIGADKVVFPERDMGVRVAYNLLSSNILDFIELSPDYSLAEIRAHKDWLNKSLKEIDMRTKHGINVMAIRREGGMNVAPKGEDMIREGDMLIVVGSNADIQRLESKEE